MTHPLDQLIWPRRTERLLLRRDAPGDLEATWSFRRLPEVYEWLGSVPTTLDAYRGAYRGENLVMVEREERVIGFLAVKVGDAWAQKEVADQAKGVQASLGWVFDPAFGGQGYASEAVRAVIDLCFGPLRLRRVIAECFADNERSWRLMERLGMRRETHTVRESLHHSKGWLDGYTYALLADEWPRSPDKDKNPENLLFRTDHPYPAAPQAPAPPRSWPQALAVTTLSSDDFFAITKDEPCSSVPVTSSRPASCPSMRARRSRTSNSTPAAPASSPRSPSKPPSSSA